MGQEETWPYIVATAKKLIISGTPSLLSTSGAHVSCRDLPCQETAEPRG